MHLLLSVMMNLPMTGVSSKCEVTSMYIVIRHSESGSIILTRHDDFNAILEEMKLDMEYAYLKEYGGDIKLKDSDQFDDIGLTFRTKKPYDDRPLVTGYLNDTYNDGKVTEYTWDLFKISLITSSITKKGHVL